MRSRPKQPDFAHHTGSKIGYLYFDGGIAALFAAFAALTVSGCHVFRLYLSVLSWTRWIDVLVKAMIKPVKMIALRGSTIRHIRHIIFPLVN